MVVGCFVAAQSDFLSETLVLILSVSPLPIEGIVPGTQERIERSRCRPEETQHSVACRRCRDDDRDMSKLTGHDDPHIRKKNEETPDLQSLREGESQGYELEPKTG